MRCEITVIRHHRSSLQNIAELGGRILRRGWVWRIRGGRLPVSQQAQVVSDAGRVAGNIERYAGELCALHVGARGESSPQRVNALLHPTTQPVGMQIQEVEEQSIEFILEPSANVRPQRAPAEEGKQPGFSIRICFEISLTSNAGIPTRSRKT